MSLDQIVDALAIPPDARVDQRVPKKLLVEQGAPTAADRKAIQDGIEEINWIAALKPGNIGVSAYRDEIREYLEIAVITASLRSEAKRTRIVELIHRAIPYPVVLAAEQGGAVYLSLAHKRWSQGEADKVVVEDVVSATPFRVDSLAEREALFLGSLAVAGLPNGDMFALYQGWVDRVTALEAASVTGTFAAPRGSDRSAELRAGLDNYARLQREIAGLRAKAAKEKQINRRVEINLEIKRLEAEQRQAAQRIGPGEAE